MRPTLWACWRIACTGTTRAGLRHVGERHAARRALEQGHAELRLRDLQVRRGLGQRAVFGHAQEDLQTVPAEGREYGAEVVFHRAMMPRAPRFLNGRHASAWLPRLRPGLQHRGLRTATRDTDHHAIPSRRARRRPARAGHLGRTAAPVGARTAGKPPPPRGAGTGRLPSAARPAGRARADGPARGLPHGLTSARCRLTTAGARTSSPRPKRCCRPACAPAARP